MWPTSGSDAIDLIQVIAALIDFRLGRSDLDRAVVGNVDLGTGLFDDFADHLAARADHFADLVDRNLHHLDTRRVLAELGAGRGQRLAHFAEDVHAPVLGLGERDAHDLFGDAGDLDVHLQRSYAAFGAGNLKIHVAEMILVAENVGEHRETLVLENESHRDARRGPLERHAGVHQRQRAAAHGCHRGRAVGFGDLGDDADRVWKFGLVRQYRMDGAPRQFAVADFAPARRADASGFADRERRKIVMQQEQFLVGALQRVDPLFVFAGAERGHDKRLGLAARKQRRAVGARQHADLGHDRTHGLDVAAVDAIAGVEDIPAYDLGFEILEHAGDLKLRIFRVFRAFRAEMPDHAILDRVDRLVPHHLVGDRISRAQVLLDEVAHFLFERRIVGQIELARLLGGLLGKLDDGLDHRLEMPVAEHHRAEHDLLGQLFGFRFDHQDRVLRSGDDEIELDSRSSRRFAD